MINLICSFGWRMASMVGLSGFQTWALEPAEPVASRHAEAEGVVVTAVEADSAAQRGGLEVGDVIVQVNRRPVSDVDGVRAAVGASTAVVVKVVRAGRPRFLVIPQAAR